MVLLISRSDCVRFIKEAKIQLRTLHRWVEFYMIMGEMMTIGISEVTLGRLATFANLRERANMSTPTTTQQHFYPMEQGSSPRPQQSLSLTFTLLQTQSSVVRCHICLWCKEHDQLFTIRVYHNESRSLAMRPIGCHFIATLQIVRFGAVYISKHMCDWLWFLGCYCTCLVGVEGHIWWVEVFPGWWCSTRSTRFCWLCSTKRTTHVHFAWLMVYTTMKLHQTGLPV